MWFPFATCAEFAWVALPRLGELIREAHGVVALTER